MKYERAAIMGVGSIGIVLGALLAQNGVDVELIDRNVANVEVLSTKGATVVGSLEMNVPVKAYTPDKMTGKYDIVFLLCKQTGTDEAMEKLMPHLHDKSVVCTLQNGIPENHIARYIGAERTLGGTVHFGAGRIAPGVSECTSSAKAMKEDTIVMLGAMTGGITPELEAAQELLSKAGRCKVHDNLMAARWKKVLLNATASGLSAALGCQFSWFLDREDGMLALIKIADEAIRVAHAEGYRMNKEGARTNFDLSTLENGRDPRELIEFYRGIWNGNARDLKASMLQDLERGRPTEIAYINGEVSRTAKKHGILTPYNDMVAALVKLAENHQQVWKPEDTMPIFRALLAADGLVTDEAI